MVVVVWQQPGLKLPEMSLANQGVQVARPAKGNFSVKGIVG